MADDENMIHNDFVDITIHTAKCDTCNKHNKSVMKQCVKCGMNFCTPCWLHRGDGTHIMNSGDSGYAGALANKAQREKFLKPYGGNVLKESSKSPSRSSTKSPSFVGSTPKRTRRTRRRRVIIEESEDEEMDNIEEQDEDCPGPVTTEQGLSSRRRGNLPGLRVEEPASPSTEGPSNQPTSAGSQFPECEDIPDFDAHQVDFGTNTVDLEDTMAGVDSLLALAAGPPSSRRSLPNNGPEVRLRGGAGSVAALGDVNDAYQNYDTSASFFAAGSENIIEQHARHLPQDHADIQALSAFTPNDPVWQSTPAASSQLLSALFPDDIDFNQALWSSTAAAFGDGLGSNEEDLWDNFLYSNETAIKGDSAEATASRSRTVSGNDGFDQGWTVPEEEDVEEGEIKEAGAGGR